MQKQLIVLWDHHLMGGGGCPTQEFFTHLEKSPLPLKGYKFWPIRQSWPLSSEGPLTCHAYCEQANLLLWSSPRTCNTQICWRAFEVELSLPSLTTYLGLWRPGLEPWSSACGYITGHCKKKKKTNQKKK